MKQFEITNNFQKKIETPLQPTAEAHFLLNDISKKIISKEALLAQEDNLLSGLFIELQDDQNSLLIDSLINMKNKGFMDSSELGVIGSFFMTARKIGPKTELLEESFIKREMSFVDFENLVTKFSIPEFIKQILVKTYNKAL